jgi:hypothetical protein
MSSRHHHCSKQKCVIVPIPIPIPITGRQVIQGTSAPPPAFFSADFNNQTDFVPPSTTIPVFRVFLPGLPVGAWSVTTDPADPTHPMNTINFPTSTKAQYYSVAAQVSGVVVPVPVGDAFLEIIFTLAPSTVVWYNSNNSGPQHAQSSGFVNAPVPGDTKTCNFAPAIVFVPPNVHAQLQCEPGVFGQDLNYTIQTSTEFGQGVSASWISINRIALV